MFQLRDERLGDFLEGEPAVDYRRRLVGARLTSESEYQRELEIVRTRKQQRVDKARR